MFSSVNKQKQNNTNSSYLWQQNIISFYNKLNKHSLYLVQNKQTRLREDLGYLAVSRIAT